MNISKLMFAGILMFATRSVQAQEDWSYINMEKVVTKDTITREGFTLIFLSKEPGFDSSVTNRMIEAFFTVYPKQAKMYNANTLKKVIFLIDPEYQGVAATSDSIIRFNPEWFLKHPGDIDVVTHEVMHIVQSYPNDAGPGWLTEGIADYVRYKFGVDNAGASWSLPEYSATNKYTDAYRVTARFLVWAENHYDKSLVKQMDAALRNKTYNDGLWKKFSGKTVDQLWDEYALNPAI